MNQDRFSELCVIHRNRIRERVGIGMLGEKTVHAVLKDYFEEDSRFQEVKIGKYYADIARNGEIFEIQTRDLYRLHDKISTFIVENCVTVVYPIVISKKIFWIDPSTGEYISGRKSNKKGKETDALFELYALRDFLLHEKFRVCVMLLEVNEYRVQDGYGKDKKKRATKLDAIPVALRDEFYLEKKEDYFRFLSKDLPNVFTASDFSRVSKCKLFVAQRAVNILTKIGLLRVIGKDGRKNKYEILNFS
ncbi:MAG: hypothetical protein E7603_04535 [Ruminococcaceae bacterium]|nr:hypothetical protein [Oscillospiraceae bacterium]